MSALPTMMFLLDHDVPDDLSYLIAQLGHHVTLLRNACNRDNFLRLAETIPHQDHRHATPSGQHTPTPDEQKES